MANLTEASEKLLFDWVLNGTTPTRPPGAWIGLSLGTPTSRTGSEVQAHRDMPADRHFRCGKLRRRERPAIIMPMTFGPFSFSNAVQGVLIFDTSAINCRDDALARYTADRAHGVIGRHGQHQCGGAHLRAVVIDAANALCPETVSSIGSVAVPRQRSRLRAFLAGPRQRRRQRRLSMARSRLCG